ncbi:MAG: PHP domain-containing protein [candidate division KSB1 bacterium]|nr:PHP domain-containing protein [candidate division KSB1 bacterium]
MKKADLHIHTLYSSDAVTKPATVLQTAAEKGMHIIAVTDHDSTGAWSELLEKGPYYGVEVVLGQEIRLWNGKFPAGDVVGLFLKQPLRSRELPALLAEIAEQDGLAVIAHPFCSRREFRAFEHIVDWQRIALEVRNGRIFNERDNEMAEVLAQKLKLPVTAGSDAHTPFEIGSVYLEFEGRNAEDLKQAILHHDVQPAGSPSCPFFSLISPFGRLGIAI